MLLLALIILTSSVSGDMTACQDDLQSLQMSLLNKEFEAFKGKTFEKQYFLRTNNVFDGLSV